MVPSETIRLKPGADSALSRAEFNQAAIRAQEQASAHVGFDCENAAVFQAVEIGPAFPRVVASPTLEPGPEVSNPKRTLLIFECNLRTAARQAFAHGHQLPLAVPQTGQTALGGHEQVASAIET
jgi:hypothetical protein